MKSFIDSINFMLDTPSIVDENLIVIKLKELLLLLSKSENSSSINSFVNTLFTPYEFAHPYKWASSVNHSEGHGKQLSTTNCDERACQTVMGNIRERLMHYSDKDFHLANTVTEGMRFGL